MGAEVTTISTVTPLTTLASFDSVSERRYVGSPGTELEFAL